jgi:hypothetical protein
MTRKRDIFELNNQHDTKGIAMRTSPFVYQAVHTAEDLIFNQRDDDVPRRNLGHH